MTKIYIDIDSILDTRKSLLDRLGIDVINYIDRESDNFKFIGLKNFREFYKHRNRVILNNAKITFILEDLKDIIAFKRGNIRDGNTEVTITVNMYPYVCLDSELDYIRTVLMNVFNNEVSVDFINEEATEKILSEHYSVVMYDGFSYLNKYAETLKSNPKPDTILMIPALVDDTSAIKDFDKLMGWLMETYSPYINLQPLKVNRFCSVEEVNKK